MAQEDEVLSLRKAMRLTLRQGGLEMLEYPTRLIASILDLADETVPEVRIATQQLDATLVAPLVHAAETPSIAALVDARTRIADELANERYVDRTIALRTADALAGGLADYLGIAFESLDGAHPAPATVQAAPAAPVLQPVSAPPASAPAPATATRAYTPSAGSPRALEEDDPAPQAQRSGMSGAATPEPAPAKRPHTPLVVVGILAAIAVVVAVVLLTQGRQTNSSVAGAGSAPAAADTPAAGVVYKIATDTEWEPFEFTDASGHLVGIDVDILDAIAADQGFEYQITPMGFDVALQGVEAGQSDGVIAGVTITPERSSAFDFSDPYYEPSICCATRRGSGISSLDDLRGQRVAVQTGTIAWELAYEMADAYGFNVVEFDTADEAFQDVIAGNSAACLAYTEQVGGAIADGSTDLTIVFEQPMGDEYGFAVAKGQNAELLRMFNEGLAHIKANGTYDQIVNTYISRG